MFAIIKQKINCLIKRLVNSLYKRLWAKEIEQKRNEEFPFKILPENLNFYQKVANSKKILFVYHINFLKKDAGCNTYTFKIIQILKNLGYAVDMLASNPLLNDFDDFEALNKKYGHLIDTLYLPKNKVSNIYNLDKNSWVTENLLEEFQTILSHTSYDFIYIHYSQLLPLAYYAPIPDHTFIVYTMHDMMVLQNFYQNMNYHDLGTNFGNEVRILQVCDKVMCISNDEKILFERFYPNKKFYFLPHFDEARFATNQNKTIDCIFLASSNMYNQKALMWLIDNVCQYLNPAIKISIAGAICEVFKNERENYYKKMQVAGFQILGFVDDINDLMSKTKISLVPMLEGTGMKIKTITAMSYGIPVVATKQGVDGFEDKNKNGCLISNDSKEFAAYVNHLYEDDAFYAQKSTEIKEYFMEHFSEEKNKNVLAEVFKVYE